VRGGGVGATEQDLRSVGQSRRNSVAGMDLMCSHTFITVHDQDEALTFYRDTLGLEVRSDAPIEDMRWVTVAPKGQPDIEIGLLPAKMGRSDADAKALDELVAKGAMAPVIFRTDDLDGLFEEVRRSGAEVLQEPMDQFYGVRDCAFRDPSGNHIRFAQPLNR
jgi:catechol 2,3-dioxygenase-like lactoylglutathione lyase family enzyme